MKSLSVNYYFYILERLESLGLDRQSVAGIVPLAFKSQTSPGNRIDIEALRELLHVAGQTLKIPHIGLNVSKMFRISNYGYAGNIFSACETISDAILCAGKYGCLAHTLGQFERDPHSDQDSKWVRYLWTPSFESKDDEYFRDITECILGNYTLTINWLSWGFDGRIHRVTFRHKPILPVSDYEDILGCDVEFEAAHNALYLDRAYLEAPVPTANPLKLSLLKQKLDRLLAEYNHESDLKGRVSYAIKKVIQNQRPTLQNVAEELSLTQRSLKRYLSKKDIHYRDVLKEVKMELCSIYLKQDVPLSDIAHRLWYADQSAFTRAYKDWYGVPPSMHNL